MPSHPSPASSAASSASLDQAFKTQILTDSPTRSRRGWIWPLVLLLIVSAAGIAWWFSQKQSSGNYQYITEPADIADLTIKVTATGTLQPLDQIDISSETSGTVKAVMVEENDHVKQGQVLLKLDTTTLEAQVRQTQANIQVTQAQIRQAEIATEEALATYRRKQTLQPQNFISAEELNAAKAAYEKAQANLQSARAQLLQVQATLALHQDQLRKATIISPFDGVVLSRQIDPGQTVAASLQAPVLFTLARDLTQMELLLDIDEADISSVKTGQKAAFSVDAYGDLHFPAVITKVHLAPQTVDGVVTYQARLKVDNPDGKLLPGMTSTADVIVAQIPQTLLVPNSALRFEPPATQDSSSRSLVSQLLPRRPPEAKKNNKSANGSQRVWVLQNGQPVAIPVKTGVSDGLRTQILSGLEAGQNVIVDTLQGNQP
ncbi:efflux RND transporter periplasmic adaptor subunit [Thiomicrorhabdus cannonii]|uniref:efflux RND transporter periplasmic adaptor subunit n=1 Tax=Thiomicrorhabdus cannonii TaxID=2748011 RepID=UPI0015BE8CC8|nr:efflux RND transporter periplasmic adaptor subunit [Thiomicrorhabdus cannonii]